MSDSESEYSDDNVDMLDQLIKEENEKDAIKQEKGVEVKEEPAHDPADQTNQSDDSEPEEKTSIVKTEDDEKPRKSKLQMREQRKIQQLRERQLHEQVFGDKNKLLHNLQITADGGAKKRKTVRQQQKRPVWHDSDDDGYDVVTKTVNNRRTQEVTEKKAYKKQLESKFQRLLGTPAWAQLDAKRKPTAADDDSDDDILRTVGHLATVKSERLPSGQLKFKQLKDLNRETYEEGPLITGIEFHPTSTVCLVAGTRGVATIFSIDGKKNDKLHSMAFENYPIRCCRLNNDGTEAIFGGSQKYFYTYDLIGGQTQRVFLPKTITKLHKFEVSPCGKYIAVIGRFGEIHLLYGSSKELIRTLKQEHEATSLAFSRDSKLLFAHCVDSDVCVYDIGEERLIHRFTDDGCINGSAITISSDGKLVAAASKQGVVNVYHYNDVISKKLPTPAKTIMNLTTAISSINFNHSAEMLAIASKEVNDAMKITHIRSGTVFNNFPGNMSKIGKPQVVQFSPQSGFMAIGSHGKEVLLYRLKHFDNY